MKITRDASLQGRENLKEEVGSINTETGTLKKFSMNIKPEHTLTQGVSLKF